ncbi:deubiquitinating protein VCPIP1-like isoform X2 [Physella acuta]|uniref:deubiquitinating protein VCPIP1-like isoform X2 n=1 Tax=Physella acuta TaxID=109671 RepID=UPI0027DDE1CE|nr:deubiquitinating protein VCPIP1-like isoform X2 [Physella acuta]
MRSNTSVLSGFCPNTHCRRRLFFPEHELSVECTGCGQRHEQSVLLNLERISKKITDMLEMFLQLKQSATDQPQAVDQESLKVNGLSNYLCAMLSPLLSIYGMDKATGKAKLLTEMGKAPTFDCAQLGDRAFLIEPEHLTVPGYGRDRSGSYSYLSGTLNLIKQANENEERLVPVHADGDGHCLVHAVSRALVGWQLFWHPLRVNLMEHFKNNFNKYQLQFQDFIDDSEWELIIRECDPDFVPLGAEPTGLRNIHIFGLANVLKRPIILLDSLEGIRSSGDYSAIFLPCFSPPSDCKNKEGVLNLPVCIAWSSSGRNHFIPLVGIKGKKCPRLHREVIQRAWGVSDSEIDKYVVFDAEGFCQVGGEKVIQTGYFQRLVTSISDIFYQQYGVSPSLIADVYQQIFKANGMVFGMNLEPIISKTKASISEGCLFICLSCHSLSLVSTPNEDLFYPGGELFELAVSCHGKLKDNQTYTFPLHGIVAKYDASLNKLIFEGNKMPVSCSHCTRTTDFRPVKTDYSVMYENGDRTMSKSKTCKCGFKHYWNGKEYDSIPKFINVLMDWGGQSVKLKVPWFQDQEDPSLNSNAYEIAQDLVQTHFPGEFGSERLVQKVVDQILYQTNKPEQEKEVEPLSGASASHDSDPLEVSDTWSPNKASKAIITGLQRQSVHKEELNKSNAERKLKQQIETNAPKQQRKLSDSERKPTIGTMEQGSRKTPERRLQPSPPASPVTVPTQPPATKITTNPTSLATESTNSNKRIRLSTSDGKNITLDIPSECSFTELQKLIGIAVDVPPTNQRIRHGFPPRELKPPARAEEDYKVPIQSGDKVMLDIIHPPAESQPQPPDKNKMHRHSGSKDMSWTSFAEGGMDEVSDRVLQRLMDPLLSSGGDNLDHSLSALALTAALENKDFWMYVQMRPHLFSVNGLFYKQVERDVGLEHGKHCQLPLLPQKVFVYNRFDDRLELCLEPYGHFPIENNVEKNACNALPASKCTNKSTSKPFSGQGHSLRSSTTQEERMPTDVPMSPKRHEARRLNTMCDPAIHQESIEEEDEENEMDKEPAEKQAPSASHRLNPAQIIRNLPLIRGAVGPHTLLPSDTKLVRKGPGYSELSPIPENAANERNEMLHQLVSRIERAAESMCNDARAISQERELSPGHVTSPTCLTANIKSKVSDPLADKYYSANQAKVSNNSNQSFISSVYDGGKNSNSSSFPCSPATDHNSNNPLMSTSDITNNNTTHSYPPQSVTNTVQRDFHTVATLAGEVALNIAAMDTDAQPVCDYDMSASKGRLEFQESEQKSGTETMEVDNLILDCQAQNTAVEDDTQTTSHSSEDSFTVQTSDCSKEVEPEKPMTESMDSS